MDVTRPDPNAKIERFRTTRLGRMELLHARYFRQEFNRHYHHEFALGVIERGALGFHYLGRDHVARAGEINLCVPGEPHNGFAPSGQGWQYRMFYLDPALLVRAAREAFDAAVGLPHFPGGVIQDPALARDLAVLHAALQNPECDALAQEERLVTALTALITRHAEARPTPRPVGCEPRAVRRAKEFIQGGFARAITLDDLSEATGLSRFHLVRLFSREVGIGPHAYLTQVRVSAAKDLLARGEPIAETALAVGFCDQSHLNRAFKRTLGVTPGVWRKGVQEISPARE